MVSFPSLAPSPASDGQKENTGTCKAPERVVGVISQEK